MKKAWLIPFSFLLLGGADPNSWQKPAYIEKAFIEIALKDEYKKTDLRIRKWLAPIKYRVNFIHLKPYAPVEHMIQAHMQQLKHITRHPIQEASNSQQANLNVYITKDRYYKDVIQKYTGSKLKNISVESNCMGTFKQNGRHEIIGATVVIPIDNTMSQGLLPACVVEELTQVMGLPNDSDWVYPSVANDVSKIELLSGLDYIFLKLLYSKEIKAGMTLQDTRKTIRHLIKNYQAGGIIKRANFKVRQEGLYPLLY